MPTAADAPELYAFDSATAIISALVDAWEPEWTTWTTDSWRNLQPSEPRKPVVGWLTYLRGVESKSLTGIETRGLSAGILVCAAEDFERVSEREIRSLRSALEKQALLRPIP